MPFPVHNNTISISIPFPRDSELNLDYTTAVSDQTFDLFMLPRAFEGTARNQTSISTLRLKFDIKTQRCVSKNDPEPIFQMSESSRKESIRGQNIKWLSVYFYSVSKRYRFGFGLHNSGLGPDFRFIHASASL